MAVKMQRASFFIFACMLLVPVSSTTTHIVGDKLGWDLPKYPGFYNDWAKKKTFAMGDVLLFQYHPGLNTVVVVNKNDYDQCTCRNVIRTFFMGNSSFTLERPGHYFFFSSVGKHCEEGQKLQVTVPVPHRSKSSH